MIFPKIVLAHNLFFLVLVKKFLEIQKIDKICNKNDIFTEDEGDEDA